MTRVLKSLDVILKPVIQRKSVTIVLATPGRENSMLLTSKTDASETIIQVGFTNQRTRTLLLLDQIKREKGVWWMPWQQEAMKDVILCDKP